MAFVTGPEVVAMLPIDTGVTPAEAQRIVDDAVGRLRESARGPLEAGAEEVVGDYAFPKALKRHYLKGEGALEFPALDKELGQVEARMKEYAELMALPERLREQRRAGLPIFPSDRKRYGV